MKNKYNDTCYSYMLLFTKQMSCLENNIVI